MPEVSEAQLATLTGAHALLNTIYGDPEHGLSVKQAVKKARPDVVIPELQAQEAVKPLVEKFDAVSAALTKLNERFDADALERKQVADADALARKMATARDRFSLTEDGVKGMTDLMREKGIMDPVDAAELYVARQPRPQVTSQRTGRYGEATYANVLGMDDEEKQKMLLSDPFRFQAMEVEEMLSDPAFADAA